jgi:hypothetical protein
MDPAQKHADPVPDTQHCHILCMPILSTIIKLRISTYFEFPVTTVMFQLSPKSKFYRNNFISPSTVPDMDPACHLAHRLRKKSWPFAHTSKNLQDCILGYSDFHNLMGFTSKKMPNNIL